MKKWAFVSDFDGTISKQDFYWMVIEKYFPEGRTLYDEWKSEKVKDIDFLSRVFKSINQEEEQIIQDIYDMAIDPHVPDFIRKVQENGGDFFILSAGTDFYIKHTLEKYGITNVPVFSNEGFYKEQNVHMNVQESNWHYHERYGIDKSKVIKKLKEEYETVDFIGDSEPDSHPAVYADTTYAIGVLQEILKERNVPFIPVSSFKEVEAHLIDSKVVTGEG
ncbi:MtnX-like HAD-IB family phosphatase [Alteribacter keqinensis]|uniref:2,3-diketo-5-methylthio-1-phosphopentane phosphatase n=1 Tax=Alteribacter keqinensis TaxID=2483800 RepID=A0A3M7TV46_9BACI|nr:MtnX-like HAD-IB family phosphatase [Alteribacter keqinensis]RNA69323.1 2,3-diketo-5-methylthio-1-phosphopentane phosphatase [Alteribacter keqinensis]